MNSELKLKIKSVISIFKARKRHVHQSTAYELSEYNDNVIIEYFLKPDFKTDSVICSITLKIKELNEFSYYIHDYGTLHNGKLAKGKYPGNWPISMPLHVNGPFSVSFNKAATEVSPEGLGDEEFVTKCLSEGRRLVERYQDNKALLQRHLQSDVAPEKRMAILLFCEQFKEARALIEGGREADGSLIRPYFSRADSYLADLGH